MAKRRGRGAVNTHADSCSGRDQHPQASADDSLVAASLPLPRDIWNAVAEALALPPQQKRIVELLLSGKPDKEIAAALQIGLPTLRTYLSRIYVRVEVADRLQLVLRIFTLAQAHGLYQQSDHAGR